MRPNRADISLLPSKRHWCQQSLAFKPFLLFSWHQNHRCWLNFADHVPNSSSFVASDVPAADSELPSTTTLTTVPTETATTPRGFRPCWDRSDICINKTLNYAGIDQAVCIERSFSYFLSRLDWSVRTVRVCSTCNSKTKAALRLARTSHSSITAFAPPPNGRKLAAIQIDWAFITSLPTASKTLVSFTFELQRKHIAYLNENVLHVLH